MDNKLHDAVTFGDLATVRHLLESGAEPDALDVTMRVSALVTAAGAGQIESIQLLLEYGANINGSSEDGMTPLHVAVQSGNLNIVHLLIERGADINATSEFGTPLIVASLADQIDCVRLLLEHGANVTEQDIEKVKRNGHADVLDVLLDFVWDKTHTPNGLPLTERAFINFVWSVLDANSETNLSLEEYLRSLWTLVQDCKPSDASFPRFAKLLTDSFTAPIATYQDEWNSYTSHPDQKKRLSQNDQLEFFKQTLLFQIVDLHNLGDEIWNNPYKWLRIISPRGYIWCNFDVISYFNGAESGCLANMRKQDNTNCNWMFLANFLEFGADYE